MEFDPSSLTGPLGGVIAVAYGAGAASGYAFCLRTLYKLLKAQLDKDENEANERIKGLISTCAARDRQIEILQDRLLYGLDRQKSQISRAGLSLLGKEEEKDNGV